MALLPCNRPGMPLLSGFLGDAVMRGPIKATQREFLGQDDNEPSV